jgi:DNA-binding LacI/PurR family transcriptional regulator
MTTQKELAKVAGVSAGTVSNVISGSTVVSDRTRKKVLNAIRALGYRPNLIARSLKTNKTNTLAIVIPEITNPFFPKLVRGAGLAAREHGRFLIVVDTDEDAVLELELISMLQSQRVDGILLVSATGDWSAGDNLALLQSGPPILCLDRVPRGLSVDSVSIDSRAAAAMGVGHLLSMGHRRIAVVTGPLNLAHERERLSGYRQALQRAGINTQDSLIWASTFDPKAIAEACHKGLLLPSDRPSALFSTNGFVALEALRSIYSAGLRTPEDIAFATIDEIASSDFFQPAITTVVQPIFEMGYRAAEALLERIDKGDALGTPRKERLSPKLVVRTSSSFVHRAPSRKQASNKGQKM